ncbi:hypothetical protein [Pseudorhodoferax soli]|uniref:Uncharacterized protein n=1 Tax=Pseudorhodoferax soli TaxID=545864 RepID=A0A368XE46_9BURK|nr:hypothetical protein [Pseudorhodoferax soli]RCW66243.1 hypothetical protein DES41_111201 [Pseudorhodoferax soli]
MTNARDDFDQRRRYVGWALMLLGTIAAVSGARYVVGFEPLPVAASPDNILMFLDFNRYFGVWPGMIGIVSGVGFLVIGLLVLKGLVRPLPANEQ